LDEVLNVKRVILKGNPETGPIIGVNKFRVRAVDNVNVPTHQTHLQSKDRRVGTLVRKDELNRVTVVNCVVA
jgi:hypothetical protein